MLLISFKDASYSVGQVSNQNFQNVAGGKDVNYSFELNLE